MTKHLRQRTGIMLAEPFDARRLIGPHRNCWNTWPVFVQPKLDGVRCRVEWLPNGPVLLSSTEDIIRSVPHINQLLQNWPKLELDGELYVHGWDFDQINSVVSRDVNLHPDHQLVKLHIFDMPSALPNSMRNEVLSALHTKYYENAHIVFVTTFLAHSITQVYEQMEYFRLLGYEGIIVRHPEAEYSRKRVQTMMKFKPKKRDDYIIVEVNEAISESGVGLGRIGSFTCRSPQDPASDLFDVSASSLKHKYSGELWHKRKQLIGLNLCVNYQNMTQRGVPRFGVAVTPLDFGE